MAERVNTGQRLSILRDHLDARFPRSAQRAPGWQKFASSGDLHKQRESILAKMPQRGPDAGVPMWMPILKSIIVEIWPDTREGWPEGTTDEEMAYANSQLPQQGVGCLCQVPPTHCPFCEAEGRPPQPGKEALLLGWALAPEEALKQNRDKLVKFSRKLKAWRAGGQGQQPSYPTLAVPKHKCLRKTMHCTPTNAGSCPLDCCATEQGRADQLRESELVASMFNCACPVCACSHTCEWKCGEYRQAVHKRTQELARAQLERRHGASAPLGDAVDNVGYNKLGHALQALAASGGAAARAAAAEVLPDAASMAGRAAAVSDVAGIMSLGGQHRKRTADQMRDERDARTACAAAALRRQTERSGQVRESRGLSPAAAPPTAPTAHSRGLPPVAVTPMRVRRLNHWSGGGKILRAKRDRCQRGTKGTKREGHRW